MKENNAAYMALDVGTNSIKAALIGIDGQLLSSHYHELSVRFPKPGWAEQDPQDWWHALCHCTGKLVDQAGPVKIINLTMCAQTAGTIAVDEHGNALAPAMIWLDSRSYPQARALMSGIPGVYGYGLIPLLRWLHVTNGAPSLTGKDPLSKFLWLRQNRQDLWDKTFKLLDVKDYLLFRLTGRYVTTPDCAHLTWLMDSRPGSWQWSESLLDRTGIPEALLPSIVNGTETIEQLNDDVASETGLPKGLPVVAGTSDITASALGSGASATGASHIYIGTSSWVACHLPRRKVDPIRNIATLASLERDRYLLIATQESAGACMQWAGNNIGMHNSSVHELEQLAHESTAGSNGLMFFPWLYGERTPVSDADVRGGFMNLSLAHTRADMARAILEGVAMNIAWSYEGLVSNGALATDSIPFVGGGARSMLWAGILAQLLHRSISVPQSPELAGLYGTAICAAIAAEYHPDVESAKIMLPERQFIEPTNNHELDERLVLFRDFYRRNRTWFQRINSS